jgi:hypothetical protein
VPRKIRRAADDRKPLPVSKRHDDHVLRHGFDIDRADLLVIEGIRALPDSLTLATGSMIAASIALTPFAVAKWSAAAISASAWARRSPPLSSGAFRAFPLSRAQPGAASPNGENRSSRGPPG